jgi:hypothetical protein
VFDAVGLVGQPVVDAVDVDGPLGMARNLGHVLDELELESVVVGDVVDHLRHVARGRLHHDHVQLHGGEAGVERRLDPLDDLVVRAAFREFGERFRVDGVLGDVDAVETGVGEVLCAPGEEGAVRGERDGHVVGDAGDDFLQVLSEHRFAAGEFDGVDAELLYHVENSHHVVRAEFVVLGGHRAPGVAESLVVTVDAVEVTPVGQGDANPGNFAAEVVFEGHTLSIIGVHRLTLLRNFIAVERGRTSPADITQSQRPCS